MKTRHASSPGGGNACNIRLLESGRNKRELVYNSVLIRRSYDPYLTSNRQLLRWSGGSVLAFGTQVRAFKPDQSRRIFQGEKENPQHAFIWKGSKAVCPMSSTYGM